MECCGLDQCDFFDCQFLKYVFPDEWYSAASEFDPIKAGYHRYGIFLQDGDRKWYAPVSVVTRDQFLDWAKEKESQLEGLERVHYVLYDHRLVEVRKQPDWLEVNLPKLREAWSHVEYYRALENAERYREFIAKKPRVAAVKTCSGSGSGTGSGSGPGIGPSEVECLC